MARAERTRRHQRDMQHSTHRYHKPDYHTPDYHKRISDHIAAALVIYTLLLIFVVTPSFEGKGAAIWPYFLLIVLVAVVILPFRAIDNRWQALANSELSDSGLAMRFTADRIKLWIIAIGIPFGLAAICRLLTATF